MPQLPLPPLLLAYFALAGVIVLWNVSVAGRIARDQKAPRGFVLVTALGALLLLPAILIAVAGVSITYGRAIQPIGWVWPAVAMLFVAQSLYALGRRLVIPLFGVPILVYNAVIAMAAVGHYLNNTGGVPPRWMLVLSAAQATSLGVIAGPQALALTSWLFVPLFSPALRSRSRIKALVRTALAIGITAATALILVEVPSAIEAIRSYERYEGARLQERPQGDLRFGLKVFPTLRGVPSEIATERDLSLGDSLGVNAIAVIVTPEGARMKALDSLARTLDLLRNDSMTLIVTLGYPRNARQLLTKSRQAYLNARFKDVDRIARTLRPNVLIPAHEPYGAGAEALGTLSPEFWIDYIAESARIAHHVNPNIKVGVAAASYGARDSTLYAWARMRGAPVDIVGFSLMPGFDGATSLDTKLRIAQRWMRNTPRPKPHWVWSAGGYPVTHGERSQLLALRGVMSWATTQPAIKGIVITEAGDYDAQQGLRSPGRRVRPAALEVARSIVAVKETATH